MFSGELVTGELVSEHEFNAWFFNAVFNAWLLELEFAESGLRIARN